MRSLLLFVCCLSAAAQPSKQLREARQAEAGGHFEAALQIYESVRKDARRTRAGAVEAEAALNTARVIEMWSAADDSQKSRLPEALEAYADVGRLGSPSQKLSAGISRANLLLRLGRSGEAVQAFRKVDLSAADPARRYYYESLFAQALESDGEKQEAYSKYLAAVHRRPSYKPAVEGVSRILRDSDPARIGDAVSLVTFLLSNNQTEVARPQILAFLEKWAGEPDSQRLLALLVRYYVAASVSPPQFQSNDRPLLAAVSGRAPRLKRAIEDLSSAYGGDSKLANDPNAARASFGGWTADSSQERAFSSLLKKIGDYYDRKEMPAIALARYYAAWAMDRKNTEAALYAATTLRDHTKELDPRGQVFDRLIENFFLAKGVMYQKEDWPNILRMHLVLAEIFERDGTWGSESQMHSAIFQLTKAILAERQVRQDYTDFPPSPGLHQRLGNAYQHVGRDPAAWEQYVDAAEGFVQYGSADQASAAMFKAKSLQFEPDAQGKERAQAVETSIVNLRREASTSPSSGDPPSPVGTRDVDTAAKKLPVVSIERELSPEGNAPRE